ncbi:hypothetical protein ANO11243_040090 [Dothideomycetidae sp. 11243]|nr:hypothetical protein ANO11243_040090 [fungal sp. No.11243]
MVRTSVAAVGVAALLLPFCSADLYSKSSPVLQLNEKRYFSDIASSNYTSNLQPAYEKAAKTLAGLAKVAAVNCDEDVNKGFCGSMGVQGFPTLKIVKPGKKAGRPFVEDYQGPRTAKGIVDAVKDKITNHVKRLQDSTIDAWIDTDKSQPKAILFTEKGTTSALLKALAIDFLGSISVAQVRDKEAATCEKYGVTSFPTLVLLPGGDAEPVVFKGKFEKPMMLNFLSQAATPNPDPAPKKAKSKPVNNAKAASDSSKLSKASASHRSADADSARASQTSETVISPEDSPNPIVDQGAQKPIDLKQAERTLELMPPLFGDDAIKSACLTRKSGTCVLLFNPADPSGDDTVKAMIALTGLTKIWNKLAARGKTFHFYNVVQSGEVRTQLGLKNEFAILAVNGKKGWLKRLDLKGEEDVGISPLEAWIDALRMGEGKKESLPEGVLIDAPPSEDAATTAPAEPVAEQSPDTAATAAAPATEDATRPSAGGEAADAEPTADEIQNESEFEDFLNDMMKEYEANGEQKGHDEL